VSVQEVSLHVLLLGVVVLLPGVPIPSPTTSVGDDPMRESVTSTVPADAAVNVKMLEPCTASVPENFWSDAVEGAVPSESRLQPLLATANTIVAKNRTIVAFTPQSYIDGGWPRHRGTTAPSRARAGPIKSARELDFVLADETTLTRVSVNVRLN
jgi:hypothetical protein